ncbi:MAG: hypothetical protein ACRENG_03925 [bacterium]
MPAKPKRSSKKLRAKAIRIKRKNTPKRANPGLPRAFGRAGSEKQANKKTLANEPLTPDDSANHDFFGTEKWRHDFDEQVNRSLKEHDEQRKATNEITRQLIAKMQAMEEMGEIYRQVDKRLKDGEWDKCRGLLREQQREILAQIYCEELVARMQQDVFNKTAADWEEHRFRRIELIKWSKLPDPDKEKWLEFYNKPSPNINLNEGENYAHQTQEHPQTSEQQETGEPQPGSRAETTGYV